jgi:hypothetical protein
MKGIQLSTMAIILIVLGIIVLLAFFYLITTSKNQVDVIQAQIALRNCCGDRSIWDCKQTNFGSIYCKVPWSTESMSLYDLANKAGIDTTSGTGNLCGFCFCGSLCS